MRLQSRIELLCSRILKNQVGTNKKRLADPYGKVVSSHTQNGPQKWSARLAALLEKTPCCIVRSAIFTWGIVSLSFTTKILHEG